MMNKDFNHKKYIEGLRQTLISLENRASEVNLTNAEWVAIRGAIRILKDKNYNENYLQKTKKQIIDRAVKWLSDRIHINQKVECNEDGQPYAASYLDYCEKRLKAVEEITEDFKKAMEE